jgi:hypothetical protein
MGLAARWTDVSGTLRRDALRSCTPRPRDVSATSAGLKLRCYFPRLVGSPW